MAESTLPLVLAAFPVIVGMVAMMTILSVYKYLAKAIKRNAFVFLIALAIFMAASAVHWWQDWTGTELDFFMHLIELIGFVFLAAASIYAMKVAKEFGKETVFSAALAFAIAGFTIKITYIEAHYISIFIGAISAILSFYAWTRFTKGAWSKIYFQSLLFRVLLVASVALSLAEHLTEIKAFEFASYFFTVAAFVLVMYIAMQLRKIHLPIARMRVE